MPGWVGHLCRQVPDALWSHAHPDPAAHAALWDGARWEASSVAVRLTPGAVAAAAEAAAAEAAGAAGAAGVAGAGAGGPEGAGEEAAHASKAVQLLVEALLDLRAPCGPEGGGAAGRGTGGGTGGGEDLSSGGMGGGSSAHAPAVAGPRGGAGGGGWLVLPVEALCVHGGCGGPGGGGGGAHAASPPPSLQHQPLSTPATPAAVAAAAPAAARPAPIPHAAVSDALVEATLCWGLLRLSGRCRLRRLELCHGAVGGGAVTALAMCAPLQRSLQALSLAHNPGLGWAQQGQQGQGQQGPPVHARCVRARLAVVVVGGGAGVVAVLAAGLQSRLL